MPFVYSHPNYTPSKISMKISFRPHHFLCTLGFQGKGYSPGFIENFSQIAFRLKENENHPIHVVDGEDSICSACPRQTNGICEIESEINALDKRHSQTLGLKNRDILTWKEAKNLLKKKMTFEAFHKACEGCQWKSLGLCEGALSELKLSNR